MTNQSSGPSCWSKVEHQLNVFNQLYAGGIFYNSRQKIFLFYAEVIFSKTIEFKLKWLSNYLSWNLFEMKITFFDSVDHFFRFDCDVNAKKPIYTYVNTYTI